MTIEQIQKQLKLARKELERAVKADIESPSPRTKLLVEEKKKKWMSWNDKLANAYFA